MAAKKIETLTDKKSTAKKTARNISATALKTTTKRKRRSTKKKSMRLLPLAAGAAAGGIFMFVVMTFAIPAVRDVADTFAAGKVARANAEALANTNSSASAGAVTSKNTPADTPASAPSPQASSPQSATVASAARDCLPNSTTQLSIPTAPNSTIPRGQTTPQQPVQSALAATIPYALNSAKLVFVFDDAGYNMSQLESFVTLPFPISVAVLPRLSHSAESADRVRKSGNEVMLHQPMQAINAKVNPGDGAIVPEMSNDEVTAIVRANIAEIAPIAGVNNHEGSLISEDEFKMMAVLGTVKESGIFYLDSRTTSQTRVHQAAIALNMGYYERNIFLDNKKDRDDILNEIRKGLDLANKNGSAIMIGHIWSSDVLPEILRELYPILQAKGYTFSTVEKSGAMITP